MITRRAGDGTVLMDREDLAVWLDRPATTIRARCVPVAYDAATGRALYDAEACRGRLAELARRFRVADGRLQPEPDDGHERLTDGGTCG